MADRNHSSHNRSFSTFPQDDLLCLIIYCFDDLLITRSLNTKIRQLRYDLKTTMKMTDLNQSTTNDSNGEIFVSQTQESEVASSNL